MIVGLRYAKIPDPDRHTVIKVLYPTPLPKNPWGVFLPLQGTSWGTQIPTVTGEALSHALHGRPKPLREQLRRDPRLTVGLVPDKDRRCRLYGKMCGLSTPECIPGSGKLPDCYEAPQEERELRLLMIAVGRAWDEGRYVFIVEGPEFLIT